MSLHQDYADALEELERLRGELKEERDARPWSSVVSAERDRLAAVLAETPDNVAALARVLESIGGAFAWEQEARAILAALRARAGLEPTPVAPLRDAGRWQCSGCRWVFRMPWQRVCPACHREDYWTASVAPDGAVWPSEPTP